MKDLFIIKKQYGEKMMQFCRANFASILDTPGKLPEILNTNFDTNKFLIHDIVSQNKQNAFIQFVLSKHGDLSAYPYNNATCNPYQYFEQANYTLTECKSVAEFYSFEKYYMHSEKLCSFLDVSYILQNNHVFFAVKKNIEEIKRKDFTSPKRQDQYGTSCMCIQFTKTENKCSSAKILNRYNSTVPNCDATFGNNLDNIIPGLHNSFEKLLDISLTNVHEFELQNYIKLNNGMFCKVNCKINNIYYLPENKVIQRNELTKFSKDDYVVADYFVICKNKQIGLSIKLFDQTMVDGFTTGLQDIENITDQVKKTKSGEKVRVLSLQLKNGDTATIILNVFNQIVSYTNQNLTELDHFFLRHNKTIKELNTPNIEKIGNMAMYYNNSIEQLSFPKLRVMDNWVLLTNSVLQSFDAPNLETCGDSFAIGSRVANPLSAVK